MLLERPLTENKWVVESAPVGRYRHRLVWQVQTKCWCGGRVDIGTAEFEPKPADVLVQTNELGGSLLWS